MKIGTKSILFGVHCFFIHPFFVALAWWRLYGFPWDPRLWVAFFVHDLGYWGKPNMDGPEGEGHVFLGATIMGNLFDYSDRWGHRNPLKPWFTKYTARACDLIFGHISKDKPDDDQLVDRGSWYCFTFYHSRFMAKRYSVPHSRLCVADKFAHVIIPRWLALLQCNLSGEIHEYMQGKGARTPAGNRSQWEWFTDVQSYLRAWVTEHRDGKEDLWTGTKRDLAMNGDQP